jgi:uroporphyrin-III C-methyltransferase
MPLTTLPTIERECLGSPAVIVVGDVVSGIAALQAPLPLVRTA